MNPGVQRTKQLLYFSRMLLNPYVTENVVLINVFTDILGLNSFKSKFTRSFSLGGSKFREAFKTQRNGGWKVGRKVFEYWSFVSVQYSPAIGYRLHHSQSITFL